MTYRQLEVLLLLFCYCFYLQIFADSCDKRGRGCGLGRRGRQRNPPRGLPLQQRAAASAVLIRGRRRRPWSQKEEKGQETQPGMKEPNQPNPYFYTTQWILFIRKGRPLFFFMHLPLTKSLKPSIFVFLACNVYLLCPYLFS